MTRQKTSAEDGSIVAAESQFQPFYETWADWIGNQIGLSVIGKLIASLIPGLVFFIIHFLCTRGEVQDSITRFHGWSWMVGVMTICCLLFLYYATDAFKGLFPQIDVWQPPDKKRVYLEPLNRTLSDRNFVIAGTCFGVLNMLMGYWYGVKYTDIASQVSIYAGFFLLGFVCGMAAWGIYGVLVTIGGIVRQGLLRLDFTAPDRCGGTRFLGQAFVKFSAVTLIMGAMISIYILFAGWAKEEDTLVEVAMGLWIVWPYLLSAVVIAIPAVEVNQALREYKLEKEKFLSERLAQLRAQLEDRSLTPDDRQSVEAGIDRFSKQRDQLYAMWTWPFGSTESIKYGVVFLVNLLVSSKGLEVSGLVSEILKKMQ